MSRSVAWLSSLFLLGALAPAPLWAVSTQQVVHRTPEAFGKGELDHIVVSEQGHLTLSPAYGKLVDLPDPIIWTSATDSQGNVYLATGSDGRVYRYRSGGKPEVLADLAELQVLALAVGPTGDLFAATSPEGKIYRIASPGTAKEGTTPEVFVDPEAKYLWDMTFDGNDLLVATGAPGGVLRVSPGKEQKALLKTTETHVLTLAQDGKGNLYAGTAENGYVYRLTPAKPDAAPFVVLDAPGDEVKRLVATPGGEVIALTLGAANDDDKDSFQLSGLLSKAAGGGKGPRRETRIYKLSAGRAPEMLWGAPDLTAHSLSFFRGQVLAGVGEEGKIIGVSLDGKVSFLADASGEQVTSMRPGPNSTLLVTVSNPASIYQIEERIVDKGIFTSSVIDSGLFADWGRIDVRQELPAGGGVAIQTRSGNTDKPDTTWSAWKEVEEGITSPSARYLQYRLTFKLKDKAAPKVREVAVFFRPVNSAPRFRDIVLMDPGIRIDRKEDFRSDPEPRGINRPKPPKGRPQVKEKEDAQMQSARWEAEDPDGDDLVYSVLLREAGSPNWRQLEVDQKEEFVNFDATALADGWYQLKVIAKDSPSNLVDEVRQAERESVPFPVDHTPPELVRTAVKAAGKRAEVKLEAIDLTTYLRAGRYSVDGGDFVPMFPDDLVYDELKEQFSFTTAELPAGDHLIVVALEDGVGNVVTGKLPVSIK